MHTNHNLMLYKILKFVGISKLYRNARDLKKKVLFSFQKIFVEVKIGILDLLLEIAGFTHFLAGFTQCFKKTFSC